jgi:anti-sigma regulatory factor (Ser/Thr protein kinase)
MTQNTGPAREIRERLILRSGGDDLESVYPWFDDIAVRLSLPSRAAFRIHVVLEEATSNAVMHGYDPGVSGEVALDITATPERVVAVLSDTGRPFNPLVDAPPPPELKPIEDAVVGGLGVKLMQTLCTQLQYRRAGDTNELTMGFDINAMAAA